MDDSRVLSCCYTALRLEGGTCVGGGRGGGEVCDHVEIQGGHGGIIDNHIHDVGFFTNNNGSVALVWAFKNLHKVVRGK